MSALDSNRRLWGVIRQREGGGRVLHLTSRDRPDVSAADGFLLWRGDLMAGVDLDVDLIAEPSAAVLAGYAVHDAVATKANEVSVALTCPALAIGASFTLPAKLIRFT